jgi:hypothetical protein
MLDIFYKPHRIVCSVRGHNVMLRKGIGSCLIGQVFKKWSQKMCNSVNLWSKIGPSSASCTYSTAHN